MEKTEVIRCRDCRYFYKPVCVKTSHLIVKRSNGYCDLAERGKYEGDTPTIMKHTKVDEVASVRLEELNPNSEQDFTLKTLKNLMILSLQDNEKDFCITINIHNDLAYGNLVTQGKAVDFTAKKGGCLNADFTYTEKNGKVDARTQTDA